MSKKRTCFILIFKFDKGTKLRFEQFRRLQEVL